MPHEENVGRISETHPPNNAETSSNTSPAVSVLMCVYKPVEKFFNEAVESILNQTFTDFEFIIVEKLPTINYQLSTINCPASAGELLKKYNDPRIVYVVKEEPTELVDQLNYGISLCRSNLIARMDADDICVPKRLEKQVGFLNKNSEIDVVSSQAIFIDRNGDKVGFRKAPLTHETIASALKRFNPILHPGAIFRKNKVIAIGKYNPDLCHLPVEDYDLWCRMLINGSHFANLRNPLIKYRLHSSASKQTQVHKTIEQSIVIKKKYFSGKLGFTASLRIWLERVLLLIPAKLVVMLFYLSEGILFKIKK